MEQQALLRDGKLVVMLACIGPEFSSGNGQNQEFLASKASK
jgi:hypothetical protein